MSFIEKLPAVKRLRAANEALRRELEITRDELQRARKPRRPARLIVDGPSQQMLEEMLAGTESHPVTKAVIGLLNARVAEMSDAATERPSPTVPAGGGIMRGYSEEERLYDAGGCAQLADFLARIQEAAKPKEQEEEVPAA